MANTIKVIGEGIQKEASAGGTITPGHLIEFSGADDVIVHATAGGLATKAFAVEDDIQGNDIDDDYLSGVNVLYRVFHSGEEVRAWLAAGENASKGSYLESNGDGLLRVHVPEVGSGAAAVVVNQIVGIATVALDLSASGVAAARLIIEIA